MSKDIGYYVDFLSPEKLEEIRNAQTSDLTRAITIAALHLEGFTGISYLQLIDSDVDRQLHTIPRTTALIRGLCDQLEQRYHQ